MNARTVEVMLRVNKTEDVVSIVLAQPEARIVAVLEAAVQLHNTTPTIASQAFLEAICAMRPQNVRVE